MIWLAAPLDPISSKRYAESRPGKLSNAVRARLAADRAEAASLRELAARYGISAEAVRLALQRKETEA